MCLIKSKRTPVPLPHPSTAAPAVPAPPAAWRVVALLGRSPELCDFCTARPSCRETSQRAPGVHVTGSSRTSQINANVSPSFRNLILVSQSDAAYTGTADRAPHSPVFPHKILEPQHLPAEFPVLDAPLQPSSPCTPVLSLSPVRGPPCRWAHRVQLSL